VTESGRILLPEAHYTLFNTTRRDLPEVICVNDALLAFEHHEIFAWHLSISIEAQELIENGMPSERESAILFEFGDRFESGLEGPNALFLARNTWNGHRILYFQVYDPEVANEFLQKVLEEKLPFRPWEYEMSHDPAWTQAGSIFELFPQASGLNS
jgi:hypothetical protein